MGLDISDRVGVMRCELRIEVRTVFQQHPYACKVRNVGMAFAREDRVVGEPLLLRTFDFGIPVSPLDQANRNAPTLPGGEVLQPIQQGQRAFLVGLDRDAQRVPAAAAVVAIDVLEDL